MQKLHNDLYIDIMHKNDVNHTLSEAYDLVQEGALFLCEHYGAYLKDIIGYTNIGKPINIEIACIRKMMKPINRKTSDLRYNVSFDAFTPVSDPSFEFQENVEKITPNTIKSSKVLI